MSNFTKLHLTHEIFRILPVFSQFVWNLTFISSGSRKKVSLVLLQMTNIVLITSLALEKCKKNAICFKLFSHKVFCPLKFKITRSPLYSVNPYLMFNECLEMKNCSFLNPWFLVRKSLCLKSNIKHSTQCFTARWNTSKFVKNTLLHVVFSTLFSVFHLVIKHFVSCLIYYLKSPKKGGGG